MYNIQLGQNVLLVWGANADMQKIETIVTEIKKTLNNTGSLSLEHEEKIIASHHSESLYDIALINIVLPCTNIPSLKVLAETLRILKPKGEVLLKCPQSESDYCNSQIKLAGYNDVSSMSPSNSTIQINASKPNFEVGSSMKLSRKVDKEANSTWKLSLNDADVDLEDPDDLLDEEDLRKPDEASLRVCGTTGQRKACKNCVCGLKEELDAEVVTEVEKVRSDTANFKSSCGSCYLGDAFRCASCPYLGMPAFKPGEKVKLTDDTL